MNELHDIWVNAAIGLGSALITLIITRIIDVIQEKKRFKRELFKLVFERKSNAVENAMSWYQEALDVYRLLQMSCNAYQEGLEDYALARLITASQLSDKVFKESSIRLNPIYLYYDFSKIEQKNKAPEALEYMNDSMNKIVALVAKIQSSEMDSEILKSSRSELKELLLSLSDSLNNQLNTIIEIQSILRNDYKIKM